MDIVRLRFEAQQCYLRAVRSADAAEIARLHALGDRLSALADQAEPDRPVTEQGSDRRHCTPAART